jgi:hypothetical protein
MYEENGKSSLMEKCNGLWKRKLPLKQEFTQQKQMHTRMPHERIIHQVTSQKVIQKKE